MPDKIFVLFCGKFELFYNQGRGNYPYECIAKDKRPNAWIFHSKGGWLSSHCLEHIGGIFYKHVWKTD